MERLLKRFSRSTLFATKAVIGFSALIAVLFHVSLDGTIAALNEITPKDGVVAIAIYFFGQGVNALRLRLFLPGLSVFQALRFTMIALLYGTALPGQLAGDAVKAFRLTRAASRSGDVSATIGAVALDKAVGLFALLFLTAVGLAFSQDSFGSGLTAIISISLALFVAVFVVVLVAPIPPILEKLGPGIGVWRKRTLRPRTLVLSLLAGLVVQCLSVTVFMVLGSATGVELSTAVWAVVVGLVSLALLLPITIAGVGLREVSLVAVLSALGQSASAALALSLVLLLLNLAGAAAGLLADLVGRDDKA